MNYPENIRQFDSSPRSPFYDDTQDQFEEMREAAVVERAKEIAAEMITPEGYSENGVIWNMSDVTEHICSHDDDESTYHTLLAELASGADIITKTLELKAFFLQQAEQIAIEIAEREVQP